MTDITETIYIEEIIFTENGFDSFVSLDAKVELTATITDEPLCIDSIDAIYLNSWKSTAKFYFKNREYVKISKSHPLYSFIEKEAMTKHEDVFLLYNERL